MCISNLFCLNYVSQESLLWLHLYIWTSENGILKQNINDQLQKTNILQHIRQEGSCSYYLKINLPDNPASLPQDIFPRELKYGSTQNFNVSFPSSFILSSELGTVQMSINKWTDKQFLVKNVMHWLIT